MAWPAVNQSCGRGEGSALRARNVAPTARSTPVWKEDFGFLLPTRRRQNAKPWLLAA